MWTIDLKDKGTVYKGPARAPAKANVTLLMSDETFEQLAAGKVCLSFAFLRSFISLFSLWLDASASGVFGSVGITALGHIWVLSDGSTLFFFLGTVGRSEGVHDRKAQDQRQRHAGNQTRRGTRGQLRFSRLGWVVHVCP